jgi:hypothetical protein
LKPTENASLLEQLILLRFYSLKEANLALLVWGYITTKQKIDHSLYRIEDLLRADHDSLLSLFTSEKDPREHIFYKVFPIFVFFASEPRASLVDDINLYREIGLRAGSIVKSAWQLISGSTQLYNYSKVYLHLHMKRARELAELPLAETTQLLFAHMKQHKLLYKDLHEEFYILDAEDVLNLAPSHQMRIGHMNEDLGALIRLLQWKKYGVGYENAVDEIVLLAWEFLCNYANKESYTSGQFSSSSFFGLYTHLPYIT